MFQLKTIQDLPCTPGQAWTFLSDPRNLSVITPPEMGFAIKTKVPEEMYEGLIIAYTVRPLAGVPVEWVTEITKVVPGHYFIDEQRIGPYRMWHHEHWIEPIEGGVRMRDLVSYALPLEPLSRPLHGLLVRPRLEQIFAYRKKRLEAIFGTMSAPAVRPKS
ncbi:MAG: cell division inhibitor [Bacteroidetes bacterium]|nr:MAG: cell division inhibitor [Bacteroidota bacterium]